MIYLTAKGLQLSTSGATNNWPMSSTGSELQLGSAGNDIFHGAGDDTLIGGMGDDTYVMWDDRSTIVERAGEGIDTIDSRVWGPVTLADNVENLFLNSPGSTAGTGNYLGNVIAAGTAGATLDGLGGDDVLVGGDGADIFRISAGNGSDAIVNFKPGHDVIQLQNYGVSSFGELKSFAVQSGPDVVFSFDNGEKLVVRDVELSKLDAYDFGLKPDAASLEPGHAQLTGPGAVYSANGWYVLNNVWNPGPLQYGTDYSIDSSYSAADPTDKTSFTWSFPLSTDAYLPIRAYPEVIFGPAPMSGGHKITDTAGVFPVQVSTLSNFVADYDVAYGGNTEGFNVSFDIWLTDVPNGGPASVTNEVMIWVHQGGLPAYGDLVGTYEDGGVTGKIYVSHSGAWTYTAVILDEDLPKGAIDVGGIFDKLQDLGIVSPTEYVASVELGAEVVAGSGSLTINNLDLTVQTHGSDGVETLMTVTGAGTTFTEIAAEIPEPPPVVVEPPPVVTEPPPPVVTEPPPVVVEPPPVVVVPPPVVTEPPPVVVEPPPVVVAPPPVVTPPPPEPAIDHRVDYDPSAAVLDGGTGHDTLVLNEGATVELGHFWSSQVPSGSSYVMGFEDVDASGATASVTLHGSPYNNTLIGSGHDDVLRGGAGFDVLQGGGGNDDLDGGGDSDHVHGGAGDDHVVYDAADYVISGDDGTDTLVLKAGATVELGNFWSSQVPAGSAYVMGFEDVDASGSTSGVTLHGSQYNNTLTGSAFADVMSGGGGYDTFVFNTALGHGNVDVITDFQPADDKLVLDNTVFSGLPAGTLDAYKFHVGTAAETPDQTIIYDDSTGKLYFDQDGSGHQYEAVQFAVIEDHAHLTNADFVII